MRLADLNWMEVERYLRVEDRIILVTGATEQHGYLSLFTDIKIPTALADAVAEREHVLVAPSLNFGCSDYFMEYPGTITLSGPTFDRVLTEIVQSLVTHGFRRFLIMNGHGGNALPAAIETLQEETDGMRVTWYSWWLGEAVTRIAAEIGQEPDHANWLENFLFTRVTEVPAEVKPKVALPESGPVRSVLGDGSFGGAYQVSDEVMARLFDALVDEAAALLRAF